MNEIPHAIQLGSFKKEDVAKREFKHACYSESVLPGSMDDMHIIKEVVTLKDGRTLPNLLFVKNFERDFGVTKKAYRNHKEKKEYEELDKLKLYKCTQRELVRKVAQALKVGGDTKRMRLGELAKDQYLYGATIDSTTILKHQYELRWPDNRTNFRIAALDFETDMLNRPNPKEAGDPIIGSYGFDGKAYLVVQRAFVAEFNDPERLIREYIREHLADVFWDHDDKRRKYREEDIIIHFVDHPVSLIKKACDDLHRLAPDIVSIWNIEFDVPMMIDTCKRYGARPEDIISDPRVPREFRRCEFDRASETREKSNGDKVPVPMIDQWHKVYLSASWHPMCGMRTYRRVRPTEPVRNSYGLDVLAKRHTKVGKFKPPGTEHLSSEEFHVHMQTKEKIAYCAYALIDPLLNLWIEHETNDLGVKLPLQCYYSPFENFKSGPKKNEDEMYFGLLKKGYMQAATSSNMTTEWCHLLQSSSNWITLLEPHLCHPDIGLKIIADSIGEGETLISIGAFDIDVSGAYPTTGVVENISRYTTKFEVISYDHLDRNRQRMIGFHLSNPKVNCVDLTKIVYQAPEFIQVRNEIVKQDSIDLKELHEGWDDYFDDSEFQEEIYGI